MTEPIEIRPEDIIKRPAEIVAKNAAGAPIKKGGFLSQIVEGIKQAKEIKKELEELGIDINLFLPGGDKGSGMPPPPPGLATAQPPDDARGQSKPVTGQPPAAPPPTLTPAQQLKAVLKILQIQYGDITVNELLENLKTQFGEKKLSDFLKEK